MKRVLTVTLNPCIDKTILTNAFDFGATNTVLNVQNCIGGKGINVSKVLNNFEIDNIATGLSAKSGSFYIKEELDKLNIKNNFISYNGDIRVNIKITDSNTKVTTELNELGSVINKETLELFFELFKDICPKEGIVVLSGSVPPGVDDNIYAELISYAHKNGTETVLDACNNLLENGIKECPYIVKPNLSEFESLSKCKLNNYIDVVRELDKFKQYGIGIFVVSMGKDGAVFSDGNNTVRAVPFCIDCKSTVGAGDAMTAALVYSYINGFDLYKTAQFATAAGTLTCCYDGSFVCNLDEVHKLYNDIKVIEIR